jgi:hemoglobin
MYRKFQRLLQSLCLATLLSAAPAIGHADNDADDSVYKAFGGQPGLTALVDDFMSIVLSDARINHTFAEASIPRVKLMLVQQFCELTGGPCKYEGKDMRSSHATLGITNAQFNALAEDLQIAMERARIPFRDQNKLLARLAPMQRDIVSR